MGRRLNAHQNEIDVAIHKAYSLFEQVPERFDEYQNRMPRRACQAFQITTDGSLVHTILEDKRT